MKRHLPSLAAALLLIAISPLEAIPVYGDFSGAVTATRGTLVSYPVGTPVTGNFRYDNSDPNGYESFVIYIDGDGYGYTSENRSGLSFGVDANGFPAGGTAGGAWDLYIGNGGSLGLSAFGDYGISVQVTYEITGVPDAGATSLLLGIALAGVAVTRRFIR